MQCAVGAVHALDIKDHLAGWGSTIWPARFGHVVPQGPDAGDDLSPVHQFGVIRHRQGRGGKVDRDPAHTLQAVDADLQGLRAVSAVKAGNGQRLVPIAPLQVRTFFDGKGADVVDANEIGVVVNTEARRVALKLKVRHLNAAVRLHSLL